MLSRPNRILAGVLALAALALLIVSWRLTPNAAGIGTHTQLGLPPCGWVLRFGRPCMTCGMTTSFASAANADFVASARAQPAGLLLAILTAAFAWGAAHTALTGLRIDRVLTSVLRPRVLWVALAIILAAWGYKLLTTPVGPFP